MDTEGRVQVLKDTQVRLRLWQTDTNVEKPKKAQAANYNGKEVKAQQSRKKPLTSEKCQSNRLSRIPVH